MLVLSKDDLRRFVEKYSTDDYILNFMYRMKNNIHKVWDLNIYKDTDNSEYIGVETRPRFHQIHLSLIELATLENGILTLKIKRTNCNNAYTCKFIAYSSKHLDIEL